MTSTSTAFGFGPTYDLTTTPSRSTTKVAGKEIQRKYVEGPVGVQARNFSKSRIHSLGWRAKVSLKEGIACTYRWIETQVKAGQEAKWLDK